MFGFFILDSKKRFLILYRYIKARALGGSLLFFLRVFDIIKGGGRTCK